MLRFVSILAALTAAACNAPSSIDAGLPPLDGGALDGGATPADAALEPDAGPPRRVLFVGNSYTYENDLPAVVRAIGAATPGGAVEVESIAVGGARLADHWTTSGARARIEAGGLDAVVLQAQSVEPFAEPEGFHYYADLLSDAVDAAGADAVWFSTWARRAGDPIYTGTYTPAQMTEDLEYRYRLAAMRHAARVARAGAAWMIALAELPEVALHSADGSHPSPAGTLLAACVIHQAITGLAPRLPDPPPLGVEPATAAALCAIAPRVVCPEGRTFCGGACVDAMQDPLHCGGCGMACEAGDPCRAGACGCDAGLTGCGGLCYDLGTSPDHCGECGTRCIDGTICAAGDCVCPAASAQEVTIEQLAALDPACDDFGDAGSLACSGAAHAHCAALDCFDAGFGPPSGHAPSPYAVMCVDADVRAIAYADLAALVPACDGVTERHSAACATAIHRYCAAAGLASGFGPLEPSAGDALSVACLARVSRVATTIAELSGFASRCIPDPVDCGVAAWNFCAARGHSGGYGPVEASPDAVEVICFEP